MFQYFNMIMGESNGGANKQSEACVLRKPFLLQAPLFLFLKNLFKKQVASFE